MTAEGRDPLVLDAGGSLFDGKSGNSVARQKARMYLEAYEELGYGVLNVGSEELTGGFGFIQDLARESGVEFISANIYSLENENLVFKPYTVIEKNGLRVGILGLIMSSSVTSPRFEIRDMVAEGLTQFSRMADKTDIQILLVNAPRGEFNNLKESFPDAEYIFTSGGTMRTQIFVAQETGKPLLYSHQKQGKYITDIHLVINDISQKITDASGYKGRADQLKAHLKRFQARDTTKTFHELYKNSPNLLRMIERYEVEVAESEKYLSEGVNMNEFKSVAMDRKIKDHPEFIPLVEKALNLKN